MRWHDTLLMSCCPGVATPRPCLSPQLALGAALLNVRIPVLLGQLVNVVARCARGHVPTYLREVRRPALRLLAVYCLQVSADPPKGRVGGVGGTPWPS